VAEAAVEGAVLRLRPIMMTALVATLGLLPAALSHDIGSDSQRPFALVIVGGLLTNLAISVFLLPTLYTVLARPGDLRSPPATDEEGAAVPVELPATHEQRGPRRWAGAAFGGPARHRPGEA
jgi:cobalt-zinc-cadmium resistance protein CzcA